MSSSQGDTLLHSWKPSLQRDAGFKALLPDSRLKKNIYINIKKHCLSYEMVATENS